MPVNLEKSNIRIARYSHKDQSHMYYKQYYMYIILQCVYLHHE